MRAASQTVAAAPESEWRAYLPLLVFVGVLAIAATALVVILLVRDGTRKPNRFFDELKSLLNDAGYSDSVTCNVVGSGWYGRETDRVRTLAVAIHVKNDGVQPQGLYSGQVSLVDERGAEYTSRSQIRQNDVYDQETYSAFSTPFDLLNPTLETSGVLLFDVGREPHQYSLRVAYKNSIKSFLLKPVDKFLQTFDHRGGLNRLE